VYIRLDGDRVLKLCRLDMRHQSVTIGRNLKAAHTILPMRIFVLGHTRENGGGTIVGHTRVVIGTHVYHIQSTGRRCPRLLSTSIIESESTPPQNIDCLSAPFDDLQYGRNLHAYVTDAGVLQIVNVGGAISNTIYRTVSPTNKSLTTARLTSTHSSETREVVVSGTAEARHDGKSKHGGETEYGGGTKYGGEAKHGGGGGDDDCDVQRGGNNRREEGDSGDDTRRDDIIVECGRNVEMKADLRGTPRLLTYLASLHTVVVVISTKRIPDNDCRQDIYTRESAPLAPTDVYELVYYPFAAIGQGGDSLSASAANVEVDGGTGGGDSLDADKSEIRGRFSDFGDAERVTAVRALTIGDREYLAITTAIVGEADAKSSGRLVFATLRYVPSVVYRRGTYVPQVLIKTHVYAQITTMPAFDCVYLAPHYICVATNLRLNVYRLTLPPTEASASSKEASASSSRRQLQHRVISTNRNRRNVPTRTKSYDSGVSSRSIAYASLPRISIYPAYTIPPPPQPLLFVPSSTRLWPSPPVPPPPLSAVWAGHGRADAFNHPHMESAWLSSSSSSSSTMPLLHFGTRRKSQSPSANAELTERIEAVAPKGTDGNTWDDDGKDERRDADRAEMEEDCEGAKEDQEEEEEEQKQESGNDEREDRGTLQLVTWCDGPYYCRNLWALGGRYVFYEDRAHNIFMCMWDEELLSLTVVAMPNVPRTRADTSATTSATMVCDTGAVAFLGYSTQNRDATAATYTRLVIEKHSSSSRVFADLAISTLPLSMSTRKYMKTTQVQVAPTNTHSTDTSTGNVRKSARARNGDDIVLPNLPHACRILCSTTDLWLASDSGQILGIQRVS
jgi:hypothetical protein